MSLRKTLQDLLVEPRTASSLAYELGIKRGDMEAELQHSIRSARAGGHRVVIEPARCRSCDFVFAEDRLAKPGRCPSCRGSRLHEALIRIER